ncbi:MAG: hypothetical protein LBP53_03215 [Candidatus Peribacteria bacterium]|jgi:hypothetical protein|nr:hypothetical protein [Candidatus Peribacteria bacterium]
MQLFVLFSLLFPFFLLEENAALPSDNFLALRSFSERVSTCALDYVADKAFLTNEYETLKGNTYLSCLYYTILGNGNGEGFPYFIKAYGDERIVEPTYEPFYFDQELIATKMHIPSCNIWDSEKEMSVETTQ